MKIDDILVKMKPARRTYILDYLIIIIILGAVYYVQTTGLFLNPIGVYGAVGVSILILLYIEISRMSTHYYLTKHQIVAKSGIFGKKIESIFLRNISEINLSQNFFQRILHYGDIIVNSRAANQLSFKRIRSPKKLVKKIEKLMKADEGK